MYCWYEYTLTESGRRVSPCNSGLFHSVYGSELFPEALFPINNRADLKALIGEDSERYVFLYGTVSQVALYR
jgi:hypothetical protein